MQDFNELQQATTWCHLPLGLSRFPINGNAQICKAAVEKMAEGFAIQLDAETGCAIRIFPDVHVNTPTGNIRSALPLAARLCRFHKA